MLNKKILTLSSLTLGLGVLLTNTNLVKASSRIDRDGNLRGSYDSYYIVRSPDGTLNCNPGPYISNSPTLIYNNGATIYVRDISIGQFDAPWIRTQNNCYVRANTKYLY